MALGSFVVKRWRRVETVRRRDLLGVLLGRMSAKTRDFSSIEMIVSTVAKSSKSDSMPDLFAINDLVRRQHTTPVDITRTPIPFFVQP